VTMSVRGERHVDAVVIGAGTAGLTAAIRLAESGAKVAVVAKGQGSNTLAAGTVDVLGYDPERVESPGDALGAFAAAHPEHPYALLGPDAVAPALEWFRSKVQEGPHAGYAYVGDLTRNHLLPTAVGALRPSALVPETMAGGDAGASRDPVCVVGTRALRDFHPKLCAENLAAGGMPARGIELELQLDRADANALGLARRMDDPAFRAGFAGRLGSRLRGDERVALPAVLGHRDPHGVWEDLERRLDRPVFEIPTIPPSVPGMRMGDLLRTALRAAGGRLVLGSPVIGAERDGTRVTAVRAHASGHDVVFHARWFVLATGGLNSGAIELGSDWVVRERALGLPVHGAPGPGEPRFLPDLFGEQPMSGVGVAVDAGLRAQGTENVLVAGASLPGAAAWKEGSGEGIALTSGHRAAQAVLAEEGMKATA
jgi:glycerol-3-phosphate dehydrogenase subunit B